jgi:hypothetical protein
MENNLLKDFSAYVEYFCTIHRKIAHSPDKKHFVRLDHEELAQSLNGKLYFPVVTLEKLTASYSNMTDNPQKSRHIEMLFLDKIPDSGNFKQIERVQSEMESLAESFIFKTKKMKRSPAFPFLRSLQFRDIEIDYVSNIATLLWGVLLSFELETPVSECVDENDFIE